MLDIDNKYLKHDGQNNPQAGGPHCMELRSYQKSQIAVEKNKVLNWGCNCGINIFCGNIFCIFYVYSILYRMAFYRNKKIKNGVQKSRYLNLPVKPIDIE